MTSAAVSSNRARRTRHLASGTLRWVTLGLATITLLIADLIAYRIIADRPEPTILGVERFDIVDSHHTRNPITYPHIPPVGGPHAPIWLNCGIYPTPVPDPNAVHSLEHGAVWITYGPDLSAPQLDNLHNLVRGRHHVILSPYPDLPTAIVASAWGRQLQLTEPTDPRLTEFVDSYRSGPQAPEKGGPCEDGTGTPSP